MPPEVSCAAAWSEGFSPPATRGPAAQPREDRIFMGTRHVQKYYRPYSHRLTPQNYHILYDHLWGCLLTKFDADGYTLEEPVDLRHPRQARILGLDADDATFYAPQRHTSPHQIHLSTITAILFCGPTFPSRESRVTF